MLEESLTLRSQIPEFLLDVGGQTTVYNLGDDQEREKLQVVSRIEETPG
jgi:hypothetical protein